MVNQMRNCRFLVASSILVLLTLKTSTVTAYDAAADFSEVNNPNGVWSEGYTTSLGSAFQLFDQFASDGVIARWTATSISPSVPTFFKNVSAAEVLTVPVGGVALHPGRGQLAVLRFTAPNAGPFSVMAQFFAGDVGVTDAAILLNDNSAAPILSVASTNTNPSFQSVIPLQAGDTLDFVVGPALDDFVSDTTPISVAISLVPEPSALAVLATGLLALATRIRRHR